MKIITKLCPTVGLTSMTHGVTMFLPHTEALKIKDEIMQKAKDMYQKKIRFPEDVCKAIQANGDLECRKFNTEIIYQLRKAYGLIESKSPSCTNN